jgi:hypothetical protein
MTKRIQESDADEEAYSQFMREYYMNRHKSWFSEHRTHHIEITRSQLLSMSLHGNQEEESGNDDHVG